MCQSEFRLGCCCRRPGFLSLKNADANQCHQPVVFEISIMDADICLLVCKRVIGTNLNYGVSVFIIPGPGIFPPFYFAKDKRFAIATFPFKFAAKRWMNFDFGEWLS